MDGTMASPELRRAHSKALRKRDQWRVRYGAISGAIRATKGRIASANHRHEFDREADVMLAALRMHARRKPPPRGRIGAKTDRRPFSVPRTDVLVIT